MRQLTKNISPWAWIPTLYFAEGIPYFIVNNISVIMFTKMGVPNGDMAMFTSLLYLPWVIKPLWSPFVDILRTKRWWIVIMQALMSLAFVLLTFTLPHPSPDIIGSGNTPVSMFTLTLVLFIITAFALLPTTSLLTDSTCWHLILRSNRSLSASGVHSIALPLSSDKAFWCSWQDI